MIKPSCDMLDLLNSLSRELASELDLHYEDEDFFALGTSIKELMKADRILRENEQPIAPVVSHVIRRYQISHN